MVADQQRILMKLGELSEELSSLSREASVDDQMGVNAGGADVVEVYSTRVTTGNP